VIHARGARWAKRTHVVFIGFFPILVIFVRFVDSADVTGALVQFQARLSGMHVLCCAM